MKHSIQRGTGTLVSGEPARTTKMADYDLICRERMEDELTCSCKTKCGVFSDVQVMEDGSGGRVLTVYAGNGFSNPAPHEYIRCPCGVSIGKAIVQV